MYYIIIATFSLLFCISSFGCDNKNNPPTASSIDAQEIDILLSEIDSARETIGGNAEIHIQTLLGENEDVRKIWIKVNPQTSTDSRLIGNVLEVPESWKIIQAGQPITITNFDDIVSWRQIESSQN